MILISYDLSYNAICKEYRKKHTTKEGEMISSCVVLFYFFKLNDAMMQDILFQIIRTL
jgi:hypothetical protein